MHDDPRDLDRSILPQLHADEAGHLRDELDELRAYVRRGDAVAVGGGLVMVWWACVLIVGNLLRLLEATGLIVIDWPLSLVEVGLGYAGNIVLMVLRRKRAQPRSWRTRTLSMMWFAAGVSIFVFVLGCKMAGVYDPRTNIAFITLCYGLILALTAAVASRSWLYWPAAGWVLVALAVFRFNSPIIRPAVFAAGLVPFMLAPGFFLAWEERLAQGMWL